MMRIRCIDTRDNKDVQRFVGFPFTLYQGCAQWVPPLIPDAKATLDRHRNPFYRNYEADFFVVEDNERILGRIAVMTSAPYTQTHATDAAFFGYFETVDDTQVSCALFGRAIAWARARNLECMRGPRMQSETGASGTLVEGFQYRPAVGIPYNYDYYDKLIKEAGFAKNTDLLSGYVSAQRQLSDRHYRIAEKVKARRQLWIKTFNSKKEMRQWIPKVGPIYGEAFAEYPDFSPPTDGEIEEFAESLLAIAEPQLIKLVMHQDRVIGFLIAYPDISAGLQKARGRIWPLGWWHILRERKRTDWVNVNGVAVLPEYQGLGASILLYTELTKTIHDLGFAHADIVQVGEANIKSRSDMETIGVKWYKRHRTYERAL